MNESYVVSWLEEQVEDYPEKFPKDFDFDSAVDQLCEWFDHQIISDELEALLVVLLTQINPKEKTAK